MNDVFPLSFRFYLPFLFIMVYLTPSASGQFGVRPFVNFENHQSLESTIRDQGGSSIRIGYPGYGAGINYWFMLKKKRIEFLPELSFSYAGNFIDNATSVSLQRFGLQIHTQIYALDFNEDCNCPTFAKQGPSINKGFFIHLTPGVNYQQFSFTLDKSSSNPDFNQKVNSNQLTWSAGLGLGLDLGLSELITLTPIASYYFYGSGDYDLVVSRGGTETKNTSFTTWQFSTRLGFRFDYKRQKYGRRR